jgi:ABC-type Fe2+-enterobactin transport system substrate-binding protein
MHEKIEHNSLKTEIERGHYRRAALIAEKIGLPEEDIRNLRYKALGQMSAIYRNVHGTKSLAQQYGFSKEEVKGVLERFADERKKEGITKPLEPCYDYRTGKYFSFAEWVDHYLKIWNKLSA